MDVRPYSVAASCGLVSRHEVSERPDLALGEDDADGHPRHGLAIGHGLKLVHDLIGRAAKDGAATRPQSSRPPGGSPP
jgi:hypothetical protein